MLNRLQETLNISGEKQQGKIKEFGIAQAYNEIRHELPPPPNKANVHTVLSKVVQGFFLTHTIFTEAQLEQHCIDNYGSFSEGEYKQALRIATNVFRGDKNV